MAARITAVGVEPLAHYCRETPQAGFVIEDPKTAFILGFVDGLLPLEMIVEVVFGATWTILPPASWC